MPPAPRWAPGWRRRPPPEAQDVCCTGTPRPQQQDKQTSNNKLLSTTTTTTGLDRLDAKWTVRLDSHLVHRQLNPLLQQGVDPLAYHGSRGTPTPYFPLPLLEFLSAAAWARPLKPWFLPVLSELDWILFAASLSIQPLQSLPAPEPPGSPPSALPERDCQYAVSLGFSCLDLLSLACFGILEPLPVRLPLPWLLPPRPPPPPLDIPRRAPPGPAAPPAARPARAARPPAPCPPRTDLDDGVSSLAEALARREAEGLLLPAELPSGLGGGKGRGPLGGLVGQAVSIIPRVVLSNCRLRCPPSAPILRHMATHATALLDGECALCNGFARLVARWDGGLRVRLVAQQSEEGARLLARHQLPRDLSTIATIEYGHPEGPRTYLRSTAVLRLARLLDWPAPALAHLLWVPAAVRDPCYGLVARHRYAVFGRKAACGLPDEALRRHLKLHRDGEE